MWITQLLSQVANVVPGNSVPAKQKDELYAGVEGMPYVATKDIGFDGIIDYQNGICIPKNYLNKFKISPIGATLVCAEGGSAGRKIAYSLNECCYVNKLVSFQPNGKIVPKFLYYYVLSAEFQLQFRGALHGLIGGVSLSKMKNFNISYPPLAEQQRIVAKLDAAFAEIDTAIEAERHSALLNEKLFSNTLEQLFDKIRLQNGSVELGKVSAKIQDGAHHSPKNVFDEKSDNQFPYVTSKNIRTNYMKLDTLKYVDADFHDSIYPRCDAKIGDVLLTKDGASTGNICLNELDEPASLLSSVCLIRGIENQILNEYICFYLQSSTGFQAVIGSMTGAAIKRIILKTIKKTPVPLPSIEEQKKLCKTTEKLLKITGNIAEIYASKIRNYEALKSSFLAQELQSEAA
jgi:type I restriction enzyme, S subunit